MATKGAREIKGDLPGWSPVVMISGRQTSPTDMQWRIDWHPQVERIMTPEEWKAFNEHVEKIADLIEEASRRPPKSGAH